MNNMMDVQKFITLRKIVQNCGITCEFIAEDIDYENGCCWPLEKRICIFYNIHSPIDWQKKFYTLIHEFGHCMIRSENMKDFLEISNRIQDPIVLPYGLNQKEKKQLWKMECNAWIDGFNSIDANLYPDISILPFIRQMLMSFLTPSKMIKKTLYTIYSII